ncbi:MULTISPECIES: helix-turn-helix domain-containing protein [Bacillus]|uniref:helix-turn-helix domain-containing protein n=1 Tax=Bacillus TaxID=1386 RepID=UPI0009931681|nr:helix-turn-helix transcriptional regulator [Bacillus mycoides]OOR61085.1 hypothetical protein BLX04_21540 [Bacillus mycoides]
MKGDKKRKFGEKIYELRKKKKFSLSELGKITGLSASYINLIENGVRTNPSIQAVVKLSEALDISTGEINSIFFYGCKFDVDHE